MSFSQPFLSYGGWGGRGCLGAHLRPARCAPQNFLTLRRYKYLQRSPGEFPGNRRETHLRNGVRTTKIRVRFSFLPLPLYFFISRFIARPCALFLALSPCPSYDSGESHLRASLHARFRVDLPHYFRCATYQLPRESDPTGRVAAMTPLYVRF